MEKKYAFASLLVLTVLVSTFGFVSASSNAAPGPSPKLLPGATYVFTVTSEGEFFSPAFPTLYGLKVNGYYDTYRVHITTAYAIRLTVVLKDGFLMGDTIGYYHPLGVLLHFAVSPAGIIIQGVLGPGVTLVFYVGYIAAPNEFPAGYFIFLDATCGSATVCL